MAGTVRWWWELLLIPFALVTIMTVLPPTWFMKPGELLYDRETKQFTYFREAASLAEIRYDCKNVDNLENCFNFDSKYPMVFGHYYWEAYLLDGSGTECRVPPFDSADIRYQWTPIGQVVFFHPDLEKCFVDGYETVIIARVRIYLFDIIPLLRPIRTRYVFPVEETTVRSIVR